MGKWRDVLKSRVPTYKEENMTKTQIFPQLNQHAFCQAHTCRNIAKHFVGKPGQGSMLRLTYMLCDRCMAEVVESIPDEYIGQQAQNLLRYIENNPEEGKKLFLETFAGLIAQLAGEDEQPETSDVKKYTCKYCGEKFDMSPRLAAHVRKCPMNPKNGGSPVGGRE